MKNVIDIFDLQQKAFNSLLPFINKYDVFICSELFNHFDKNIILRNSDGENYSKKLIGFQIETNGILLQNIYINDKFLNEKGEHYNTFCYYSYTTKHWTFFSGNISNQEMIGILKFVSTSLIRKLKLKKLYE